MRRTVLWFALFSLLAPSTSGALELHWSTGADTLSFTEARTCTLLVVADPEVGLPSEWELLWAADSNSIEFHAFYSSLACAQDVAQISNFDRIWAPADSTPDELTARFCSGDSAGATTARYIIDLSAGSHGRFKVVSADPADSTATVESSEVTFNGGGDGSFSAAMVQASSSHTSMRLSITVSGTGLTIAQSAALVAPDSSWQVPLAITAQSYSALTLGAEVAATLPAAVLEVVCSDGSVLKEPIAADEVLEPSTALTAPVVVKAHAGYRPKDFAFIYDPRTAMDGYGMFHIYYIMNNETIPDTAADFDKKDERKLGHAWSRNLQTWSLDSTEFIARHGKWDNGHVWAPSIVQQGPTWYMFYTGVDSVTGKQQIGVATTSVLDTTNTVWTRQDAPIFSAAQSVWASTSPHYYSGKQQFRDPFVMPDPISSTPTSTHWLMYYVAALDSVTENMGVGLARSVGTSLTSWIDYGLISATDRYYGLDAIVESPHAFFHHDANNVYDWWWLVYSTPYRAAGQTISTVQDSFLHTVTPAAPLDTMHAHFRQSRLPQYLGNDAPLLLNAYASEYLKAGRPEFLAAARNDSILIYQVNWTGSFVQDVLGLGPASVTGVSDRRGVGDGLGLVVTDMGLGRGDVQLRIELPVASNVRLEVFDVQGRRLRTLINGKLPRGGTPVTWSNHKGEGVATGMYLVRLKSPLGQRVVRVPVIL